MRRIKKSSEPPLLTAFRQAKPLATWEKFRRSKARYEEVSSLIRKDQGGLCAYCEVDLLKAVSAGKCDDFRVDHFYPKSPHTPPPNWSLEWQNLLGSCHGGSQPDVEDASRFTAPELSCDCPKENHNWTTLILNPLTDVPQSPRIFLFSNDGKIEVDSASCPLPLSVKASETITRLRLNSKRLQRMRKAVIEALQDAIAEQLAAGATTADAIKTVVAAQFAGTPARLPAFVTCIRWYFGGAAENELVRRGLL